MYYIPYIIYHVLYTLYDMPYILYHTLYTRYYIPYILYHTLYTVYYIPYIPILNPYKAILALLSTAFKIGAHCSEPFKGAKGPYWGPIGKTLDYIPS